jgi:peptidoglycan DL-endopeptidase CwlO
VITGPGRSGRARMVIVALVGVACLAGLALLVLPVLMFAGGGLLSESGGACTSAPGGATPQPPASQAAQNSIPADYLFWFKQVGAQYGVPWVVLAGIGEVESDDGQTDLPGVHSGANPFGAAGPMQIGIGGAAGNEWGGAPVHPASEQVNGVATDETGDGIASVYVPGDAIAGAAKYLLEHGVLDNVEQAIFAYNHLWSYVQTVMYWAGLYAKGGYTVSPVTEDSAPECLPGVGQAPNGTTADAIAYAEEQLSKPYQFSLSPAGLPMIGSRVCPVQSGAVDAARTATGVLGAGLDFYQRCVAENVILYAANQLGKPYQWGATGPDSFDCSGLTMMAYRYAGVYIPRTSQEQWLFGPRVSQSDVEPGDLVFFAGSDGTMIAPGHVGIVIGHGLMIDAPYTGVDVRIEPYADTPDLVGFTRPAA